MGRDLVDPNQRELLLEAKDVGGIRCDEAKDEGVIRCDSLDIYRRHQRRRVFKTTMGLNEAKDEGGIGCDEAKDEEAIRCDSLDIYRRKYLEAKDEEAIRCDLLILFSSQPMAIHYVVASDEKMIDDKQEVHSNYRRSCYGSLSLAPFFLPCAGGTGHGSGQPEHQGYSEIYQSTLDIVSTCPSPREYMQKSIAKCVDVCGSYMLDGNCTYHCMRDSSKTKLVEFCAKPKILFDYCPEYDPVDQTIQKDLVTLCNSKNSIRDFYNSSDIYFCDPENCLQLYQSSERSGSTTLTTLMNETTEINDGDSQEWYIPLITCVVGLIVIILIGCIFWVFYKRRRFSGNPSRTGKRTTKRNRNRIKYQFQKIIKNVEM